MSDWCFGDGLGGDTSLEMMMNVYIDWEILLHKTFNNNNHRCAIMYYCILLLYNGVFFPRTIWYEDLNLLSHFVSTVLLNELIANFWIYMQLLTDMMHYFIIYFFHNWRNLDILLCYRVWYIPCVNNVSQYFRKVTESSVHLLD